MEELLTLKEVAQLLRLSPQTVYKLIQENTLIGIKVGNQWRFNPQQVQEWLKQHQVVSLPH